MKTIAFSAVLLVGLTACAVSWQGEYLYKPGATNAEKASDYVDCAVEAANQVPVNSQIGTTPVYHAPTQTSPMITSCSGFGYGVNCMTTGGQTTGGQTYGGQVYSYDTNASLRVDVAKQCMMRKGYSFTPATICTASQTPKGMTASMSDLIIPASGKFCVVPISDHAGIPVQLQ